MLLTASACIPMHVFQKINADTLVPTEEKRLAT